MVWLGLVLGVLAVSGLIGRHVHRFRDACTEMTGMMLGMTMGMLNGLVLGYAIAAATMPNGMFWGNLFGILFGVTLGADFGRDGGLMGVMDGGMGGVMGGSMGAMLSVMLHFPDEVLAGTAVLLGALYILGMGAVVVLVEQRAPDYAHLHRVAPLFRRRASAAPSGPGSTEPSNDEPGSGVTAGPARRLVDYYRVLGVRRNAGPDAIAEAYLVKAQDADPRVRARVERAIAVLTDPVQRREYDRALAANRAEPRPPPAAGVGPRRAGRSRPEPVRGIPLPGVAAVAAAVLLLAGGWWAITSKSTPDPGAGTGARGAIRSTSRTGAVQLSLVVAPDPPRPGPTTFTLQVQDPQGQPVSGAAVQWSMDMTNMRMGPQGGQMTALGAGQYQARGAFSMGGPWRLSVTVSRAGQSLGTGYFDLDIR